MGWVVKSVKPGALDAFASDLARAAAAEIVAGAQRDARRARRAAARETADALAAFAELETFGVLTRRLVRERRAALRQTPTEVSEATPAPRCVTPHPGRARLRRSPLRDLFRATA